MTKQERRHWKIFAAMILATFAAFAFVFLPGRWHDWQAWAGFMGISTLLSLFGAILWMFPYLAILEEQDLAEHNAELRRIEK